MTATPLMVRIHEAFDEERPLMEVLRDLDASSILGDDDPRLPELRAIRETILENDRALSRLIELRPEHRESYERQWCQAENDLEDRLRKLNIRCL